MCCLGNSACGLKSFSAKPVELLALGAPDTLERHGRFLLTVLALPGPSKSLERDFEELRVNSPHFAWQSEKKERKKEKKSS